MGKGLWDWEDVIRNCCQQHHQIDQFGDKLINLIKQVHHNLPFVRISIIDSTPLPPSLIDHHHQLVFFFISCNLSMSD